MQDRFYAVAVLTGILLHATIFCRNEWDRHAPRVLHSAYIFYAFTALFLASRFGYSISQSLTEAFLLGASLLGGLFSSMITYRLLLHPLKSFPGPLGARLTSFWIIKQNVPDLKFYVKLRNLHDRYGDFVRIRE